MTPEIKEAGRNKLKEEISQDLELVDLLAKKFVCGNFEKRDEMKYLSRIFNLSLGIAKKQYSRRLGAGKDKLTLYDKYKTELTKAVNDVFIRYVVNKNLEADKPYSHLLRVALKHAYINAKKKETEESKKIISMDEASRGSKYKLEEKIEDIRISDRDDVAPDVVRAYLEGTDKGFDFFITTKLSKERANTDRTWVQKVLTYNWFPGIKNYDESEYIVFKFVCTQLISHIIEFMKSFSKNKYTQAQLAEEENRTKSSYNKTRERYAKACLELGIKTEDAVLYSLGTLLLKYTKPVVFIKSITLGNIKNEEKNSSSN